MKRKIYKTGQTRGADDDVIYQNRVNRNSTVLIPYDCWDLCTAGHSGAAFENGFIVLIAPRVYFGTPDISDRLGARGLALGENALVFYETRQDWQENNPEERGWKEATSRRSPLGGQYVARIPGTTAASGGDRLVRGFNATTMKGAGIRVYEYASSETIADCRLQLEALFWMCADSESVVVANGMEPVAAEARRSAILDRCTTRGLLDRERLASARIVNAHNKTICPLCLEGLPSQGFFNRMEQAEGRAVADLTVTEVNLFHIAELRMSALNHRPYNLGWGHHHCNVVVKDAGIDKTIDWMRGVLQRNTEEGYLSDPKRMG
ncbi:MAG: BstXI family restriction endonuclease [Phycisphaerales bacterium]|nr:BstXI family restriction endonuclease [Phycisphaerales bacterium]